MKPESIVIYHVSDDALYICATDGVNQWDVNAGCPCASRDELLEVIDSLDLSDYDRAELVASCS